MAKKKHKQKSKLGMAPGSLVFTGQQKMAQVDISVIHYSEDHVEEKKPKTTEEVISLVKSSNGVTWINIDGLHDERSIEEICTFLAIHKLSMEDILNVGQRPKLEEYRDYVQAVIKILTIDPDDISIEYEQISFILKGNLLVTFQEKTGDVFNSVRTRIKEKKGSIRRKGADYLLYALLDTVVDHYFLVLEDFGEKLEDLETELLENPDKSTLNKLHSLRRETLLLRRSIYPLREMIGHFEKLDEPLISNEIKVFIRDLYDHTIKVIETIEVLRDMTSGLLDLYMNSASNKMNEIMKVLTIMSTIFIPLTFIAGVYGMNFTNMPELRAQNGYFIILGVMFVVFIGMLIFLKRKKWF
ncbi:MAG TPA: magnesium/cobalt transporter CorA [Draconibacterium sp.]|nr:magnesium/cobalt transporter CorA [Draconibacterium sp.]HRX10544.1 magnesium/cobalt transporter CorA [Draconibacterium sp.]